MPLKGLLEVEGGYNQGLASWDTGTTGWPGVRVP